MIEFPKSTIYMINQIISSLVMATQPETSEFINYLANHTKANPEDPQLPSLKALSDELGVSVARLREQLEAAKTLGLVEVRPRTGIKRLPYRFNQAVWESLSFAVAVDPGKFYAFAHLRQKVELSFWHQAVASLTPEDKIMLQDLVQKAETMLSGNPVRIPHIEHREFHTAIYRRLNNPFVLGILDVYWDAYEAVGLSLYSDLEFLQEVWAYHRKMVEAISKDDPAAGYLALAKHTDLLDHHPATTYPEIPR
jgi:DNA-binding FadR family transcriptional regulator